MALDALGSAFREGDERVFFTLLKIAAPRLDPMSDPAAGGLDALDMAWQAAYVAGDRLTDEQVDILAALVRGGGGKQGVRDAQELARVVEARRGKDAARALLQKIADTTKVPGLADQLREAMRR
jgi:mono/diheme cytochrome c family protein